MSALVADRIRSSLASLPRAERRVAHELLSAYPVAGLETVARLAARAQVSGPTVIRLVSRLGYDGYPEFQDALLQEIEERTASPLLQFDRLSATEDDAVTRTQTTVTSALETSLRELDREGFSLAMDLLTDTKRRVVTAGGRFSGLSAHVLALHMQLLRPSVMFLPHERWVSYLMDARRGDVAVIFDVRRYQRSTIDFGRTCAQRGVSVILVTDPWMSPLALEATALLQVSVDSASPFDSQVPALALVEAMVASAVERLGEEAVARLSDYDSLWDQQGFSTVPASGDA